MGRIIFEEDEATSTLEYYMLGYHRAVDSTAYPDIFNNYAEGRTDWDLAKLSIVLFENEYNPNQFQLVDTSILHPGTVLE